MKTANLPVMEVELIAVSRAILGMGIELLGHDYLSLKRGARTV